MFLYRGYIPLDAGTVPSTDSYIGTKYVITFWDYNLEYENNMSVLLVVVDKGAELQNSVFLSESDPSQWELQWKRHHILIVLSVE